MSQPTTTSVLWENPPSHALETRILLIDDDPLTHEMSHAQLRDYNFTLLAASDGVEGLAIARQTLVDLILLDLRMPGLNGFEVCSQLKSTPLTCDIPVLFFSVHNEDKDKVEAFSRGAVDYISKPVGGEELTARVIVHLRQHIQLRAMRHRLAAFDQCAGANLPVADVDNDQEYPIERRAKRIEQARRILLQHITKPPRLDELAEQVGCSANTLSRDFQVVHGLTVFAWLKEQRLQHAAKLLRNSRLPVASIAEQLGYSNPPHLCRLFRQRFKVTPNQYRRSV